MAITKAEFNAIPNAPELPTSIADTDNVDDYIIQLLRHAATVDFTNNTDTNLSDRPYRWGISEDSKFDASVEIPVTLGSLTVS